MTHEWQPIETAPKDGTTILLYVGKFCDDYAVAFWYGDYWHVGLKEYARYTDRYDFEFGNPTHWMPLPEPPNAT